MGTMSNNRGSLNKKNKRGGRRKKFRTRGGNYKFRALRLNYGSFTWRNIGLSIRAKILSVAYNYTSLRFAKKKFLLKGTIVKIKSKPFKKIIKKDFWRFNELFPSNTTEDILLAKIIQKGFMLARITSRPGQSGRVNGVILTKNELTMILKKIKNLLKIL